MAEASSTPTFEPVDLEAWREQARRDLGGRDPANLTRELLDGIELQPLYVTPETPVDRGVPGAPPFVRGSQAARVWRVVHEVVGDGLEDSLGRGERALREGADQLWWGAEACATLANGQELDRLRSVGSPVWLAPREHATALAAAWLEAPGALTVLSDPLGVLATEGRLPTSVERAFVHLAEVVGEAARRAPGARTVLVSGRPYHEAGAGAVEELGIVMAAGIAYLRGLSDAGRPLADVPRRMLFELVTDADFFVAIAKLRAARLLWSKLLRTLGIDGPEQGLQLRARTSRRATSRIDPHLNLLRGTAAAAGAVLGGAQWVTVGAHDELDGPPSAHAERLARNTQLLMREESHLGQVLDPSGGSYFLEALTDRIARAAWLVLQEIEHLGGVPRALADGSLLERVRSSADARRRALATRTRALVGVSRYPSPEAGVAAPSAEEPPEAVSSAEGAAPTEAAPTEAAPTEAAPELGRVGEAARGPVLPALMAAQGEPLAALSAALAAGDAPAVVEPLPAMRDAEPYEALRARAAALPEPRALLLAVGERKALAPRVDFAREALEVGGLEAVGGAIAPDAEHAREQLTDARVAVLCAADERYEALLRELGPALRERGVTKLVVATQPTEALSEALSEAGADLFVHRGCDLVGVLEALVATLEERP
jgi:methylmalonyl-CoA mutase